MKNKKTTWRKSLLYWLFAAIGAYGAFQLVRMLWMEFLLHSAQGQTVIATSEVYSAGIIGGADGPTAIIVSGPAWTPYVLPCILLAVGILGFFVLRKRKK